MPRLSLGEIRGFVPPDKGRAASRGPATGWPRAGSPLCTKRTHWPSRCWRTSCGTAGKTSLGPTGQRHPSTAPVRHTSADPLIGQEALDSYFPASGASYTRGLAFTWTQEKIEVHDTSPCLAKAGFPQPPFRESRQLYQLSFRDNSQFPDLRQLAAHPGDYSFTRQYPVLHNPTSARMKAFAHAQARCTARYAQPVTRVDKAANTLENAWLNIISAIEHSLPVRATQRAFARCLQDHGVPANLATRTDNSAGNPLFYGYFSWGDGTNQAAHTARQLAADQRHETQVFVACAGPAVSVLERIQLERRAQFFREHAAQVARIVRLAEEMTGRR
jgi:hypothetical protein